MGESTLLGLGIFVVLLFLAGILFTVKEFQEMDESEQRNYEKREMNIKKKNS